MVGLFVDTVAIWSHVFRVCVNVMTDTITTDSTYGHTQYQWPKYPLLTILTKKRPFCFYLSKMSCHYCESKNIHNLMYSHAIVTGGGVVGMGNVFGFRAVESSEKLCVGGGMTFSTIIKC